jgi:hypothetical protein
MEKWPRQQGMVSGAAGFCRRRLQRHHPADDRGQLFHPGYFRPGQRVFVGTEWFKEMLADKRLHDALGASSCSRAGAADRNPLGILIALAMPKKGWGVSASLVTLACPC